MNALDRKHNQLPHKIKVKREQREAEYYHYIRNKEKRVNKHERRNKYR